MDDSSYINVILWSTSNEEIFQEGQMKLIKKKSKKNVSVLKIVNLQKLLEEKYRYFVLNGSDLLYCQNTR